uniref:Myosin IXA n=1 Tax=Petromyzon marinus TaxID=7757 RepID=S4RFE2_PETMA
YCKDNEQHFPQATNETLLAKFRRQHDGNKYYESTAVMEPAFIIKHYAGRVKYCIKDFREKNTDHMRPDIVALLRSSESAFVRSLISIDPVAVFRWAVLRAFFRAAWALRALGKNATESLKPGKGTPTRVRSRGSALTVSWKCMRSAMNVMHVKLKSLPWHEGEKPLLLANWMNMKNDPFAFIIKGKNVKSRQSIPKHLLDVNSLKHIVNLTLHDRTTKSLLHLNKKKKPPSISAQFQTSLNKLMETLDHADPFFIRCIRSNADKMPLRFDEKVVLRQLRYTGMLETVHIRQAGYSVRYSFKQFAQVFYVLMPHNSGESKEDITNFLETMRLNPRNFQIGHAKVFMKESERKILAAALHTAVLSRITLIQGWFRAALERRRFLRARQAASTIQACWRRYRLCWRIVRLQAACRGFVARKRYKILLEQNKKEDIKRQNNTDRVKDRQEKWTKRLETRNAQTEADRKHLEKTLGTTTPEDEGRLFAKGGSPTELADKGVDPLRDDLLRASSSSSIEDENVGESKTAVSMRDRPKSLPLEKQSQVRAKRLSRRQRELEQADYSLGYARQRSGDTLPSVTPTSEELVLPTPDSESSSKFNITEQSIGQAEKPSSPTPYEEQRDLGKQSTRSPTSAVSRIKQDGHEEGLKMQTPSTADAPKAPESADTSVRSPEDKAFDEGRPTTNLLQKLEERNRAMQGKQQKRQQDKDEHQMMTLIRQQREALKSERLDLERRDASGLTIQFSEEQSLSFDLSRDLHELSKLLLFIALRQSTEAASDEDEPISPASPAQLPHKALSLQDRGAELTAVAMSVSNKQVFLYEKWDERYARVGEGAVPVSGQLLSWPPDDATTQPASLPSSTTVPKPPSAQDKRHVLLQTQTHSPPPKVQRRKSLKISNLLSSSAQSKHSDAQVISSHDNLRQMIGFLQGKINDLLPDDGKNIDGIFKEALKEFRKNLEQTNTRVTFYNEDICMRHKDLISNFEQVLDKTVRQRPYVTDKMQINNVCINLFSGFMVQFMGKCQALDDSNVIKAPKNERKKKRKKESDGVVEHNGHQFRTVQFNIPSFCEACATRIWIMDRGYVCRACKFACHKKCYSSTTRRCTGYYNANKKAGGDMVGKQFAVDLFRLTGPDRSVPFLLEKLLNYIEIHGLYTEGIYRKSGANTKVKELRQQLDNDVNSVNLDDYQVHVIGSVLKQWLRELPVPLMTLDLYDEFLRAVGVPEKKEKIKAVYSIIGQLPSVNYSTLERIIFHLVRIAQYEDTNRMSCNALAIVFAPCILRPPDTTDPLQSMRDIGQTTHCVELLVEEQMRKFKTRFADISTLESVENSANQRLSLIRRS